MKYSTLKYIIRCILILILDQSQSYLYAQMDSLNLIPYEDTIQARKYIEGNSFSDELKHEMWTNRTNKTRSNYHELVIYYYEKRTTSVPNSFSPKKKVEEYTRYSIFATNKYILDKSLLYAYRAEDIAENADDDYMRGKVNHALGWYYAANCDYHRAHRTYDKAIGYFKSVGYQIGVRNTMVKKAIALQLQDQNKEALKIYNDVYYLEGRKPTQSDLALLIKSTFKNGDTIRTDSLLDTYFKNLGKKGFSSYRTNYLRSIKAAIQNNDSLELYFLNQAEAIVKERSQPKEHFTMLMHLGKFYLAGNQLTKAKKNFKHASAIAYKKLMHNRFDEPNTYLLRIAELEDNIVEQNEYKSIQRYYQNVIDQKISVSNIIENNQKSILIRQKNEIQSQNQKIWILTALGFIGIGLLLFSFFYFRKYKKIVEDLSNKNKLLDVSVNEKQTLLQETHHRVKNNLQIIASLLNLQRKYTKDKKLTAALIDGRNRVKSMALIHQLLYQKKDLKGINVRSYVENLMSSLFGSLKANEENIHFINNVNPLNLHEDTLLAIGLIINEIVTNSLKYAFKEEDEGEVKITLIKKESHLFLSVSDNGCGIPDEFDINDKSSFGYSLITSLSKKLDATIAIDSDNGTVVNLDIFKYIEIRN